MTALDLGDSKTWLSYHGVTVAHGKAILYKAVDADLTAGHEYILTGYPLGETVTAPEWESTQVCGHGLHFGLSPTHARSYYNGSGDARYLAVEVDVATLVPLGDKAKAPSCRVLYEVDIHGDPINVAVGEIPGGAR
jgi:hypothetical protein